VQGVAQLGAGCISVGSKKYTVGSRVYLSWEQKVHIWEQGVAQFRAGCGLDGSRVYCSSVNSLLVPIKGSTLYLLCKLAWVTVCTVPVCTEPSGVLSLSSEHFDGHWKDTMCSLNNG
jgi:hypothetical protein